MKHVTLPLIVALLITSSAVAPMSFLPTSQAQPTTLLSVDFTGSMLPAGWFLTGDAAFVGGFDNTTKAGGVLLINGGGTQAGAVYYGSPITNQSIVIDFSAAYWKGFDVYFGDLGVGFYSSGPTGSQKPTSNGYYATYGFCCGPTTLFYNTNAISTGTATDNLPHGDNDQYYLFGEIIITPTSVSMNALVNKNSFYSERPAITLDNLLLLTYNNVVEN